MTIFGKKSSKAIRKGMACSIAVAMLVTSLATSSVDVLAAKKVKKINIGVKVGKSGILVLKKGQSKKLNVTVTPKKASKKVTYKSSNKKVVKVSSKGVAKALKKKGTVKITVTSKQNEKKKATITVKIGTPIKKVTIQNTATVKWTSSNFELKTVNGQLRKIYPSFKEKVTKKNGAFQVQAGRTITLKATLSPKKPTSKKVQWSADKSSRYVALVPSGRTCVVSAKKVSGKDNYTVKVTAKAMDGSGKKSSVKIQVGAFVSDKTPAPTEAPDTRKLTTVEDFESYAVGTKWDKYTAAGKNCGTMTVVADPENPNNKCLEVKYDGTDTAYDFAPVIPVDLAKKTDSTGNSTAGKTLRNYTGIDADIRVVGNDGDVLYKAIFCYFDQYGAIQPSDKFAASANGTASAHVDSNGNVVSAGDPNEDKSLRFGVWLTHALGSDVEFSRKLFNGNSSKEKHRYMPCYNANSWVMEDSTKWFTSDSCTTGYKPNEGAGKVGFASKSLIIDQSRINELDSTLLDQSKFDIAIGSTYQGNTKYANMGTSVTLYFDNIKLAEEVTPITGIALSTSGEAKVAPGVTLGIAAAYTPENTTQKGLTWTTNHEKVTVDGNGTITVAEDFAFPKGETETKVVVTATSVVNPAITASIEVVVYKVETQGGDFVLTADMVNTELSDTTAEVVEAEGTQYTKLNYTKNNQYIFFELPEEIDLSAYESVEMTCKVPEQLAFRAYSADFSKEVANWWDESATVATYPFFKGSRPGRLEDGTPDGDIGIETQTYVLNSIKTGDWSKTKYIAISSNGVPEDDWEVANYAIHQIKFIAKEAEEEDTSGPLVNYTETFDETVEPWFARFNQDDNVAAGLDTKLSVSSEARTGSGAMLISDRLKNWNSPGIDLTARMVPGSTYKVSFWAKIPESDEDFADGIDLRVSAAYILEEGGAEAYENYPADTNYPIVADEWTYIETEFTTPASLASYVFYVETAGAAKASFLMDDFSMVRLSESEPFDPTLPSLKETYATVGIEKFGIATGYAPLLAENDSGFIKHHFNSVTFGNEMKPDAMISSNLITTEDEAASQYVLNDTYANHDENKDADGNVVIPVINYENMDKYMKAIADNGLSFRFHTFVWHQQMPKYFFTEGYSTAEDAVLVTDPQVMLDREEMFIRSLMSHMLKSEYASTLYTVDVVNEYTHMDNISAALGSDNWWRYSFGEEMKTDCEYVKKAFVWCYDELVKANRTDVSLIYNDYNTYQIGITESIVELIHNINTKDDVNTVGKICAGVGMQMHFNDSTATIENLNRALTMFKDNGFEIQITELDVTNTGKVTSETSEEDKAEVWAENATMYGDIMSTLIAQKKAGANITSVTIWGSCDAASWRPDRAPLLFGASLADKKPAFDAVINAVLNANQ